MDQTTKTIIFIPDAGEMPDAFTEVVNSLPVGRGLKPRIAPWSGGEEEGQGNVEALLDKHELRRVILVGSGRGAAVALRVAQQQPQRITHLVLDTPAISLDARGLKVGRVLKKIPGFLFRDRNKKELLTHVAELSSSTAADFADVATPTLVLRGSQYPVPDAASLVDTLPNVVGVTVEGAGLRTYRTHPAEFGTRLGQFLENHS